MSVNILGSKNNMKSALSNVLSAFRDVIISTQEAEKQHEPTSTEYFAIICSTVTTSTETEHLSEVLQILDSVISSSSKGIVQMQSKILLPFLLRLIDSCSDDSSQSRRILRHALSNIASLSLVIESSDAIWSTKLGYATINTLLGHIDDGNLKIQKSIHSTLQSLLNMHKRNNYMTIRSYVAEFCIGVMKNCTRSEYKRSLHIIFLLEKIGICIPESKIEELFHTSLNLEACGQPILTAAVYRMFDCCFQDTGNTFSHRQILSCIHILMKKKVVTLDMETNTYYCTCLASAVTCLIKANPTTNLEIFSTVISVILQSCESEFVQVHCAVATGIKRILSAVLSERVIQSYKEKDTMRSIKSIVRAMETIMLLRFQYSWLYVLDAVRLLFEKLRGDCASSFLKEIVTKLCELYHALETGTIQVDKPAHLAVADTVGSALRCCGVNMFLSLAPLRLSSNLSYVHIDDSRDWILLIMQNNLRLMSCNLGDFGRHMLSIAGNYNQLIKSSNESSASSPLKFSDADIHHMRMRVIQLWSLFPEFCYYGASDIASTFPRMPEVLEACLQDPSYPELHQPIFQGLTYIAKFSYDRKLVNDVEVLKSYAATIIGSVLKILEQTDFHEIKFQLGVQCIGAWIAVAPKKTVDAIAKQLLQLLLKSTTADELRQQIGSNNNKMMMSNSGADCQQQHNVAAGWMSIMLVVIPHLSNTFIDLLYRSIRLLLLPASSTSSSESSTYSASMATIQKRAYHILESLLTIHAQKLFEFEKPLDILAAISTSLLTCPVGSRSLRLKCIEMLLIAIEDPMEKKAAVDDVFQDVLICIKDSNKRTRDEAIGLLRVIINLGGKPSADNDDVDDNDAMDVDVDDGAVDYVAHDMFMRLTVGVHGETSLIRSSAIIGMCMLLLEKRGDTAVMQLAVDFFPTIASLLDGERCSEQTRAVLSFVRVCAAALPVEFLKQVLPQLVYCFTDGLADEKSKYLSRCRAIMRKLVHRLHEDDLKQLIPATDLPLLVYIQRMNRRTKRQRSEQTKERLQRMLDSDSDDDSDDEESEGEEEMEENPRLTSRPKAQRVEDVVKTFTTSADDLLDEGFGSSSRVQVRIKVKPLTTASNATPAIAKQSNHKPSSMRDDFMQDDDSDGDDDFDVVVSADGKVVLKEKETVAPPDHHDTLDMNSKQASSSDAAKNQRKRVREPGDEYRSKKAGGDVWKKGMLQPHAYIPLDPRLLSHKNRREALTKIGSVVSKKSKRGTISAGIKIKARKGGVVGNRRQRQSARSHSK